MNRFFAGLAFLALPGLSGEALAQDPSFDLRIDGPSDVGSGFGREATYDAVATLTTSGLVEGDLGAGGWSLSVSASGSPASPCGFTAATTRGTIAADVNDDPPGIRNTGFEKTELVTGQRPCFTPPCAGAVSGVVLSLTALVFLPPTGSQDILNLSVQVRELAPEQA